jgi:hypothetical protein
MISDPWIDRGELFRPLGVRRGETEKRTPESQLSLVSQRRARLRRAKKCINGPEVGNVGRYGVEHGQVVSGGKCQRCLDVAAGSRL